MISCRPVPAAAGSNTFPVIPGPENVPPAGIPVSVAGGSAESYCGSSPENETIGISQTVVD